MYVQYGTLIAFNINLYRCNICGEKLIGEEQILEHHKSLTHAVYIQKESVIKATEPIQCIQSPVLGKGFDSELIAALIELKKDYQRYAQFPGLHPMYAVEMQTFCKQNSTSITTGKNLLCIISSANFHSNFFFILTFRQLHLENGNLSKEMDFTNPGLL